MRSIGILGFALWLLVVASFACTRTDGAQITDVAREFLAAAADGDSIAVRKSSVGGQPLRFWEHYRADQQLLRTAAAGLKLDTAREVPDTGSTVALFTFVFRGERRSVSAEFVKVDGVHLISRIYIS
jgi:hypothetical protein